MLRTFIKIYIISLLFSESRVYSPTLHSVLGIGTPKEPYFQPSRGVVCVAGLASDIP